MTYLDRLKLRAPRVAGWLRRVVPVSVLRWVRTATSRRRRVFLASLRPFSPPAPTPAVPQLCVAVAAGERVRAGLAWEWAQLDVAPSSWQETINGHRIDLLLVEIVGGEVPAWGAVASGTLNPLLSWARDANVPVVAWVTGTSAQADPADSWIGSAAQIFLDSEQVLDLWRSRWPAASVGVLEPAAQPRLHNPRTGRAGRHRDAAGAVIVHGKTSALDAWTEPARDDLDIWPADAESAAMLTGGPLRRSVVVNRRIDSRSPTLSRYRVLAEVGADDPTPSWWIVEAGCAETAVVVDNAGLDRIPADLRPLVTVAEDPQSFHLDLGARIWQEELRDREGLRLARAVWDRHTYRERVDRIAAAVGLDIDRQGRTVSAVVSTNRAHQLDNILDMVARQQHSEHGQTELIIVLHGFDSNISEIEARAADQGLPSTTIIRADRSLTLGACLNLGIDAAQGEFIAKMDDDNFYGRHYLTDLVAAFDYTDAGIVGKWAHYVWLRSTGAVVLRFKYAEHRYERLVQGGSILMKRDAAQALRFSDLPRGVDTDLLDRARLAGILTYSSDRFNFVSIRGTDRHAHTWAIADTGLLNRVGDLVFFGDPRLHVEV
jgi:Glycosyl transferase family 2